jgi:hypothetical protein
MSIEQARLKLPLERLMEQHGDFVKLARGTINCPFCEKKSASMKEMRGRQWFKCFRPECPSGTSEKKGAGDELGYLAFKTGLSREAAFGAYLK